MLPNVAVNWDSTLECKSWSNFQLSTSISIEVDICVSTMSGMRTILTSAALVGVVGVGYGMWSIIVPGEERRKEIIKNLPESNPVRMEETRKRNILVMQTLKEAAETNENIARGIGRSTK